METKSQVINYLQSNFLGIGFQELNDLVINNQNCVLFHGFGFHSIVVCKAIQ